MKKIYLAAVGLLVVLLGSLYTYQLGKRTPSTVEPKPGTCSIGQTNCENEVKAKSNLTDYSYDEPGFKLSIPTEMQVESELVDGELFTIHIERGIYPDPDYYQLYGMFKYTETEGLLLNDLEEPLNNESIKKFQISGYPALSGQYEAESDRFVTFVVTNKGFFTFTTSQPTTDNHQLTEQILSTLEFY